MAAKAGQQAQRPGTASTHLLQRAGLAHQEGALQPVVSAVVGVPLRGDQALQAGDRVSTNLDGSMAASVRWLQEAGEQAFLQLPRAARLQAMLLPPCGRPRSTGG